MILYVVSCVNTVFYILKECDIYQKLYPNFCANIPHACPGCSVRRCGRVVIRLNKIVKINVKGWKNGVRYGIIGKESFNFG